MVRGTVARRAAGAGAATNASRWTTTTLAAARMHMTPSRLRPITPPPPPPPAQPSSSTAAPARSNVSARPTLIRSKPLPHVPNTLPALAAFTIAALASWAAFTLYATNKEKLSSSIFKSIVSQVKHSPQVSALFSSSPEGAMVVLKRETLLGGTPKVNGAVNMMQGRVDLSFKIHAQGDERKTATVYFTSIRAHKHAPFEILRFVVVDDATGDSVSLLDRMGLTSIDVESGDIV
ncbi:uncharacterized protein SRS1_11625 [Sporisorium reilianum f. sp. reilianum]|uniref:Uncharacterized protein n=1 Tax=Sporisorium reilianum f. sp. reilianum TaxID=72559 RepID=A0A2N8U6F5_9BASI|nr:uncharacterized protein SRS1_11625 [Sporisorium reilianum f. sp. reilianum]